MVPPGVLFQCREDVGEDECLDMLRPKEVQVLEMGHFLRNGMSWKFSEHGFDVDEAVAATVHQQDWRFDVSSWELRRLVVSVTGANTQRRLDVIVVHLEAFVSDYLEPMHHALDAGVREEVRIRGELLV